MLKDYLDKITHKDCIEVMKDIEESSIDLIITSPPYNLKNSTGNGMSHNTKSGKWATAALRNGYANHHDNMPHNEYVNWQRNCLTQMMRVLKDNGAIFYNHKWRVQAGLLQDRHDILEGFPVRQIIIWKRKGGINFNPGYFLPTYEVVYMIAKKDFFLAPKANAHGDVWEFTQEMKNPHPAAFPVELVDRIIKSTKAKIILDPFIGSGTTAISAIKNKRQYVGIDISKEYCDHAAKRIEQFTLALKRGTVKNSTIF
jgi:site-specific DNA-methyltransferase (adenine-specific)